jgi:hypothetical protein
VAGDSHLSFKPSAASHLQPSHGTASRSPLELHPACCSIGDGECSKGACRAVAADEDVVGTSRVRELERQVRELERLLGRKTMETEILKEALDVAR